MRSIYLDYATTTPLCPAAQQAMLPFLAEQFESPEGWGPGAEAVRQAVEDARFRVRRAIGADDVCPLWFTSGLWENLQSVIFGCAPPEAFAIERRHLVLSPWEHPAVLAAAETLARRSLADVTVLDCDPEGVVSPAEVARVLEAPGALVSIAHASATTGVIQPIAEISQVCRQAGARLHVDASTTLGLCHVDVSELGADWVSLSSEHTYGPKGVGALWMRQGVELEPRFVGDDHGAGRVGYRNPAGIVGFAAAAQLASDSVHEAAPRVRQLRDQLAQELRAALGDDLTIHSAAAPRVPNILCCSLGKIDPERLLAYHPEVVGAIVSLPSQYATPDSPSRQPTALRLSVGWYTDGEEVTRAASLLVDAWERLK